MAHENYPNGWKDGWSSADHATESYSPYAWERARREAGSGIYEEKKENKFQSYRETEAEKRQRELELEKEQTEKKYQENRNRKEAVNILVSRERDAYYRRSKFKRAIDTLKGKSFEKREQQIRAEAEKKVAGMYNIEVENLIKYEGRRK